MDRSEIARALGKAGGDARAAALSSQQRKAIAKKAARARWGSKTKAGSK